jgi:peptidoglycan/LPS O-acetylase OafA/YrhL
VSGVGAVLASGLHVMLVLEALPRRRPDDAGAEAKMSRDPTPARLDRRRGKCRLAGDMIDSERGETGTPSTKMRLHGLDGLRAVAVSLVVLHHWAFASFGIDLAKKGHPFLGGLVTTGTASGVELFFVLSGTVLLRPYLRLGRDLQLGTYVRRRVQRLWPPFLAAWLLAGLAIFLASRYPTWWTVTAGLPPFRVREWLLQLPIVYVRGIYYNFAWWTLAVEVLFYAVVPLVVLARPRGRSAPAVAAIAGAIVFVVAELPLHSSSPVGQLATIFVSYAPCFALGVLLAARDYDDRLLIAASISGAILVAGSLAGWGNNVLTGYGIFYAGIAGLAQKNAPRVAVLSALPMVWLGERSYSLFLSHFSVFGLVCHFVSVWVHGKTGRYLAVTRLVDLPLAILTAMALFQVVEAKFARGLVTARTVWPPLSWAIPTASLPDEPQRVFPSLPG